MATDAEILRTAEAMGKIGIQVSREHIARLLDAGLLVAPPAPPPPPPEVTFRARAHEWDGGIFISAAEIGDATRGRGFRHDYTLEVTLRQVGP